MEVSKIQEKIRIIISNNGKNIRVIHYPINLNIKDNDRN